VSPRSFILVTLDSCRWDSFERAHSPFFDSLGSALPGRSHSDMTLGSHIGLLSGFFHKCQAWSPKRSFKPVWLASEFKRLGYTTLGAISLPFCSSTWGFDRDFDAWDEQLKGYDGKEVFVKPLKQSLAFLSERMEEREGPYFIFLNIGETHMPYRHAEMEKYPWERVHKHLIHEFCSHRQDAPQELLRDMHEAQVAMAGWVDARLGEFPWPEDAAWYVTADHGEFFGEDHLFGHGIGCHNLEVRVPVLCSDWMWLEENA
jgi:hypothetical protein